LSGVIVHITSRSDWITAKKEGVFSTDTLIGEGFIHCSKMKQLLRVANYYYAGQHGLVLLVINSTNLKSEIRWEPGTDKADELFPHIYGKINLDAVLKVVDFEPGEDGKFHLSPELII
jgi:uncharacterized protein (DUF952 family)